MDNTKHPQSTEHPAKRRPGDLRPGDQVAPFPGTDVPHDDSAEPGPAKQPGEPGAPRGPPQRLMDPAWHPEPGSVRGPPHPAITDDETLINSAQLRKMMGGVSDMWLHRRLSDAKAEFPKPTVIANRRYWRVGEIRAWFAAQAGKTRARGPVAASTVAVLLMLLAAPSTPQIWAFWTSPMTPARDPDRPARAETAGAAVFAALGATAWGSVAQKLVGHDRPRNTASKRPCKASRDRRGVATERSTATHIALKDMFDAVLQVPEHRQN
jgi:hypothetical protein